jgi:hypothetical protein
MQGFLFSKAVPLEVFEAKFMVEKAITLTAMAEKRHK